MSPLQYLLLDEKKSGFDLLIATDGSIMYCDRKAIVVPPMRFYAMDLGCDRIAKGLRHLWTDRILAAQFTLINECIRRAL
jgi:hypothetical protein